MLAAGGSARLGRPKQLERYRNRALLIHAAQLGNALSDDRVLVVLGAHRLKLLAALRRSGLALTAAFNRHWPKGMGSSLACGINLLPDGARAALILLTDQPGISLTDLNRLVNDWRRHPTTAVAAEYAGRVGVPAVLPRRMFRALGRLTGDAGARDLLRDVPRLVRVPMPNAAFDVDTETDVKRLRAGTRDDRASPA